MKILALDPATKTGFAHTCGISGFWDLSIRRDESAGMRLIRLRGKLEEIKNEVGVELVAFEAARNAGFRHQGALVVQTEIQAVIKIWCEDHKIDYRGYSPTQIKKHATGKGNASKEQMIDAAISRFKKVFENSDEVDALWLLDLAKKELGL